MKSQDYYQILKVDRCATDTEIKHAYRVLAHRFHPDVSEDRDGESKFKDISEAYRTLKQSDSRSTYDRQIRNFCIRTKAANAVDFSYLLFSYSGFSHWHYWLWFWLMQADRKQ